MQSSKEFRANGFCDNLPSEFHADSRQEKDSLGEVQVPRDALFGPQTQRAVENFPISGRPIHPELIRAYLRLKEATALANEEAGVLNAENASLIQAAVHELLALPESQWGPIFPVDALQAGAGTSTHMNINEVIANVANRQAGQPLGTYSPIDPNNHVNRSQSTNDTFPTAMRMALLEASAPLTAELNLLAAEFETLGKLWWNLPKSARTHLQDAVPMRLGQEFAAYGQTLHRCAQWIDGGREELRRVGLGGSAAGTGLNVPAGYIARAIEEISRLTNESFYPSSDRVEAMQSQAPIGYYSSMLRLMALELTRICNDLRLLASGPMTGISEIILPAVQPGSSIMPGKTNPSILEAANQTWFTVLGHDHTVAYALQAGQLELNVMMPVMAHALLDATRISTHMLFTLRQRCIAGVQPNRSQLKKNYESSAQIATALTPLLGYLTVAELVQEALANGVSVIHLVRQRQLITDDILSELLSPSNVLGGSP